MAMIEGIFTDGGGNKKPTLVKVGSDGAIATTGVAAPGVLINISGTITTGGTAQNAAAANTARLGYALQNNSTGDLWFNSLATAVMSQPSIRLVAGAYFETPVGGAGSGAVSIIGATTGQAWSGREW